MLTPAQLDADAEQAGADHADRIVEALALAPVEAAQRILDFGALSLEAAVDKFATILREVVPESEVGELCELIRAAYSARLAFRLWPAEGRG
jgi:hypothetical protein